VKDTVLHKDLFSHRVASTWDDYSESITDKATIMAMNHFKGLLGAQLDFYGADTGGNTFKVDDVVFRVLEDPNDGYRSCLGAIDYTTESDSIFFSQPIARVKLVTFSRIIEERYDSGGFYGAPSSEGYQLVDAEDGHVWLYFGTDNTDDYYPYFVFQYFPKEKKDVEQ